MNLTLGELQFVLMCAMIIAPIIYLFISFNSICSIDPYLFTENCQKQNNFLIISTIIAEFILGAILIKIGWEK